MNNICFNERQNIWTTRYDWIPTISENLQDKFYSIGGIQSDGDNTSIWKHDFDKSNVTQWYNKQHYFEFEFVVSDPIGVHKIIDNLRIVSNNVQPEQLTFEILGDAYMFNKERIIHLGRADEDFEGRIQSNLLNKDDKNIPNKEESIVYKFDLSNWFRNASKVKHFNGVEWNNDLDKMVPTMIQDKRTKQYIISIPQECRNIETWGRRLGNIYYKEDSWYTNVEPLIYDSRLNDPNSDLSGETTKWSSTRIRDKWCKIKVRYSGEDLAIITALITSINI